MSPGQKLGDSQLFPTFPNFHGVDNWQIPFCFSSYAGCLGTEAARRCIEAWFRGFDLALCGWFQDVSTCFDMSQRTCFNYGDYGNYDNYDLSSLSSWRWSPKLVNAWRKRAGRLTTTKERRHCGDHAQGRRHPISKRMEPKKTHDLKHL